MYIRVLGQEAVGLSTGYIRDDIDSQILHLLREIDWS